MVHNMYIYIYMSIRSDFKKIFTNRFAWHIYNNYIILRSFTTWTLLWLYLPLLLVRAPVL